MTSIAEPHKNIMRAKTGHCMLHPLVDVFLFQYKRLTLPVFREIIGLYHIDHITIALLNSNHEVIFFSATPAIEYQLIHSGLWQHDPCLDGAFYGVENSCIWPVLTDSPKHEALQYIKLRRHHFAYGLVLSRPQQMLYTLYSFASRKPNFAEIDISIVAQLGDYCAQQCTRLVIDELLGG